MRDQQKNRRYGLKWWSPPCKESCWILGSRDELIYRVYIDENLTFGLVERCCCETSTCFSMGVKLLLLLNIWCFRRLLRFRLSYFVSPVQSTVLQQIQENLEKAWKYLNGLNANSHTRWLKFFMTSGKDYEDEAFCIVKWRHSSIYFGNQNNCSFGILMVSKVFLFGWVHVPFFGCDYFINPHHSMGNIRLWFLVFIRFE